MRTNRPGTEMQPGRSAMTSSKKRIRANRRNAKRSTGPRTEAGKRKSRMNALKHGLDAQTLILPGEDEAEFQARLVDWRADLMPRNEPEEALVAEAVRLSWSRDRADRIAEADDDDGPTEAEADAEADAIGRRLLDGPPIVRPPAAATADEA